MEELAALVSFYEDSRARSGRRPMTNSADNFRGDLVETIDSCVLDQVEREPGQGLCVGIDGGERVAEGETEL